VRKSIEQLNRSIEHYIDLVTLDSKGVMHRPSIVDGKYPLLNRLFGRTRMVDAIDDAQQRKAQLRTQLDDIMATPVLERSTGVAFVTFTSIGCAKRFRQACARMAYTNLEYINTLCTPPSSTSTSCYDAIPMPSAATAKPSDAPRTAAALSADSIAATQNTPLLANQRERIRSGNLRPYGSLLTEMSSLTDSDMEDIPLEPPPPQSRQARKAAAGDVAYENKMKLVGLHHKLHVCRYSDPTCANCCCANLCPMPRSTSGLLMLHQVSMIYSGSIWVSVWADRSPSRSRSTLSLS
jgi:hypothetical protein